MIDGQLHSIDDGLGSNLCISTETFGAGSQATPSLFELESSIEGRRIGGADARACPPCPLSRDCYPRFVSAGFALALAPVKARCSPEIHLHPWFGNIKRPSSQ